MLKVARAAMYTLVPAEAVVLVLVAAGVSLPRPVTAGAQAAVAVVVLLELVAAGRLVIAARRCGDGWWAAIRSVEMLWPEKVRRIMSFDFKGLVSLGLLVARRRHGVPPGAVGVSYSGGQLSFQMAFLFAMAVEVVGVEFLLRGLDVPERVRMVVLVADLYSILVVLAVIAACVTRPHVLSEEELRIRYGAFFDLRVPRDQIASVRVARNFNESGKVRVEDEKVSVAVAAQTNVVVELSEPVVVVRPLGSRATARTIRFFADDPAVLVGAFTDAGLVERSPVGRLKG